MIRLTAVVAMAAVASGVVSCGRSDGERIATPRPRAYPRIEVAESDYRRGDSLPSGFAVSSRAEAVLGGSGDNRWLTIVYPDYGGARLHLTFTVSDDPDAVSANRIERIALNAGHASLSASDTTVGGEMASITFFRCDEPSVTPLQMIARCGTLTVSGALTGLDSEASPDSLGPLLDAIERDFAAGMDSTAIHSSVLWRGR